MGYIVVLVFAITAILAFLEKFIKKEYKIILYLSISIALILTAGLREVGLDPDSQNYENTFLHYNNPNLLEGIEYSYLFLSEMFNHFTHDVHALFLFYAFFAVGIKFLAFRKLSEFYFLPIVVYIGYYYIMHECMQMRTGILSALLLFFVKALSDGEKKKAIILMLLGLVFHYSALLLLPFFFINNNPLNQKKRFIWGATIPFAYVFAMAGLSFLLNASLDLPFIGSKLAFYQEAQQKGMADNTINIFSPLNLFSILLYFYLLYFYDTIKEKNKYFPIMMKILTIAIVFHVTFSFFPVVAVRTYMLFSTITIILHSNVYYTIKPKWAGILIVVIIAFVYLNYSIPNIGTNLLWKAE